MQTSSAVTPMPARTQQPRIQRMMRCRQAQSTRPGTLVVSQNVDEVAEDLEESYAPPFWERSVAGNLTKCEY